MRCHPSNMHFPGAKVDKEQHVIRHEPAECQTSAVKKSVATRTSMCVRINSFHVVVFLRSRLARDHGARMLPTVWSLMV